MAERKLLHTKSLQVKAAASVYGICRKYNIPVTIKELGEATGASRTEIARCYKSIARQMEITPHVQNGMTHVLKVASKLGVSREVTVLSVQIIDSATKQGVDGNPMALAGAAVYVACLVTGEVIRQYQAAEAAGVTEGSVRTWSKLLRPIAVTLKQPSANLVDAEDRG